MITFGPKFPVPDLGDAFRRSFFVRDNNNEVTLMDLVRILHALNPRALDNVPMTYRGVLPAVWGELKKLFPIYAWTESEMLARDEDELVYFAQIIPVEVSGIYWYEQDPGAVSPALCVCALFWRPFDFEEFLHAPQMKKYVAHVRPAYDKLVNTLTPSRSDAEYDDGAVYDERYIKLRTPRGRVWHSAWEAFPKTVQYASSQTGIAFLDWDQYTLDENGYDAYPPMTLADIRALAHQWREAKHTLKRIEAFCKWADADPARVGLMARVLAGDKDALHQITEAQHA